MPTNSEVQLDLLPSRSAEPVSIDLQEEVARRCRSRHEAIQKTYEYSGYTNQARVYGPLGWSQGTFSKVWSGAKSLPQEDYHNYQQVCANWILLRYDAWKAKHAIKPVVSDAESRIRELESELADRDRAIKLLGDMLRGK